jgi:hypothetical protein
MSQAPRCIAKTKRGVRCPNPAGASSDYCFSHDPARASARAAAHKRGGRARHTPHNPNAPALPADVRTLDDARAILAHVLAEALVMDNSIQRGRLLVSVATAALEFVKVGEIEVRLAAVEAALKARP